MIFQPVPYNSTTGSSESCAKSFSLTDPPYVQLSSQTLDTGVSAPTITFLELIIQNLTTHS